MGAQTMSDNLELSFIAEPVASGTESQTAMTLDPIEVEVEIENLGVFTGWETSGSGTFANPMALQTTYTPTNGDYELVDIVLTATFTGCGYKTYTFEVNVHFAQDAVISLNEATMSIHPNPTNDVLNIAVDNISSRIDITIYNSVGQMVYYKSDAAENGYNSTISLGDLSNGTYILQVRSDENVWTERIIKR